MVVMTFMWLSLKDVETVNDAYPVTSSLGEDFSF